jgi:chaperonin GroEL (HSP60 family)
MKAKVQNPRILLLSSSLEFQRTARFSSFDALLQQEKQHLQIVVNKIAALKPDVVVVEKTVSRLALEFLLKVTVESFFGSWALSRNGTPRRVSHYRPTSRSS